MIQFLEFHSHTFCRNVSLTPEENIDFPRTFRPAVVNKITKKETPKISNNDAMPVKGNVTYIS